MTASTEGLTGAEINQKHVWLQQALRMGQQELATADEKVVRAKERHLAAGVRVRQQAREQARADGVKLTVSELDDLTFEGTADERWDLDMAEHTLRALKERQRTLHSQVDSVEAMGHNLRAEMRLGGGS